MVVFVIWYSLQRDFVGTKHVVKMPLFMTFWTSEASRKFSTGLKTKLRKVERKTNNNTLIQVNIALNYGSRQELINAFKKINYNKKKIITEKLISNNLYTKNIPDPEILIRTGNTNRLSNFLLWQINYTDIFFVRELWPHFNKNDFNAIS